MQNFPERRGSNIMGALSAGMLAVTATAPVAQAQLAFPRKIAGPNIIDAGTAAGMSLAYARDERLYVPLEDRGYDLSNWRSLALWEEHHDHWATSRYGSVTDLPAENDNLAPSAISLRDCVDMPAVDAISALTKKFEAPAPKIKQKDAGTSIDYLHKDKLLTLVVEAENCFLVSFTASSEYQITYNLMEGKLSWEALSVISILLENLTRAG